MMLIFLVLGALMDWVGIVLLVMPVFACRSCRNCRSSWA